MSSFTLDDEMHHPRRPSTSTVHHIHQHRSPSSASTTTINAPISPVVFSPRDDFQHFFAADAAPPTSTQPLFHVDEAPHVALSSMLETTPMILTWVPKGVPVDEMMMHHDDPVDGIAIVSRQDPCYFGENSLVELIAPSHGVTTSSSSRELAEMVNPLAPDDDAEVAMNASLHATDTIHVQEDEYAQRTHITPPSLQSSHTMPTTVTHTTHPVVINVPPTSFSGPHAMTMSNQHILRNTVNDVHAGMSSSYPTNMNRILSHNINANAPRGGWRPCGLGHTRRALQQGGCIIFTDEFIDAHPHTPVAAITQACQSQPRALLPRSSVMASLERPDDGMNDAELRRFAALDCIREAEAQRRPLFRRVPSAEKYGRSVYANHVEEDEMHME